MLYITQYWHKRHIPMSINSCLGNYLCCIDLALWCRSFRNGLSVWDSNMDDYKITMCGYAIIGLVIINNILTVNIIGGLL